MNSERGSLVDAVYQVLPKRDCGLCGYGTCQRFARAVVDRRAPLSGCQQDPLAAHRIAEILGAGAGVGSHDSRIQPASPEREASDAVLTTATVRRELDSIMEEVDEILARISTLEKRLR